MRISIVSLFILIRLVKKEGEKKKVGRKEGAKKFSYFKVIFATVLTYFKKPYADILYLSLWCIHSKPYYSLSHGKWEYAGRYVLYTIKIILVFL